MPSLPHFHSLKAFLSVPLTQVHLKVLCMERFRTGVRGGGEKGGKGIPMPRRFASASPSLIQLHPFFQLFFILYSSLSLFSVLFLLLLYSFLHSSQCFLSSYSLTKREKLPRAFDEKLSSIYCPGILSNILEFSSLNDSGQVK